MTNALNNTGLFLINTLFDLYMLVWVIRIILVWVHADYFNPLTQFIIKLTKPIVAPLRRIIPTYANIEFASIIIVILLGMLKFFLVGMITMGLPNIFGLLLLAIADVFKYVLNVFFYAILLQAILSWVQFGFSPANYLLAQITAPIMRPFQRIIPPIGGFDITPIPVLIILQVLLILIANPLLLMGMDMAFG